MRVCTSRLNALTEIEIWAMARFLLPPIVRLIPDEANVSAHHGSSQF
jgi:hypothetical protein